MIKPPRAKLTRETISPDLMLLLDRLKAYIVEWKFTFVPTENVEYEPGIDREAVDLRDPAANVVSSELKATTYYKFADDGELVPDQRHIIAVDIDHPAHYVPSSTPNHGHLYVDIPGGIDWEDYQAWLLASAKIGLLEDGYVEVSIKRGHTDLRLPWVSKDDQKRVTQAEQEQRIKSRYKGETISPRVHSDAKPEVSASWDDLF